MKITVIPFIIAAVLAGFILTWLVRRMAVRAGVVDRPSEAPDRKTERGPVPLWGGGAVYGAFCVILLAVLLLRPSLLLGGYLLLKHIVGILIGGALLVVGGMIDDRRSQTPQRQILWPIAAALAVIASGIGISYLSNPIGDAFRLDRWSWTILTISGVPYHIVPLADLLAFLWIMVAIYTTKFLDGLDGLVSGVTVIGMVVLFGISMLPVVGQPETALLALFAGGAFFGFLLWNFYPAKIFLGEGGSTLAGFLLGTLAIVSGGKIATALLILGIPLLDLAWVVARRFFAEHRPITAADRKHLHFRLLDVGLSHRQAVLVLYLITALFGSSTLFFHGAQKLLVLAVLAVVMAVLGVMLVLKTRGKKQKGEISVL